MRRRRSSSSRYLALRNSPKNELIMRLKPVCLPTTNIKKKLGQTNSNISLHKSKAACHKSAIFHRDDRPDLSAHPVPYSPVQAPAPPPALHLLPPPSPPQRGDAAPHRDRPWRVQGNYQVCPYHCACHCPSQLLFYIFIITI